MAIVYIKQASNLECLTGVDQADPNAAKVWLNKIDGFVSRAAFTPEYLITSDDFFVSPGEHNMDVQLIWHGPTGYDGTTSSRSAAAPFESIDLTLNEKMHYHCGARIRGVYFDLELDDSIAGTLVQTWSFPANLGTDR